MTVIRLRLWSQTLFLSLCCFPFPLHWRVFPYIFTMCWDLTRRKYRYVSGATTKSYFYAAAPFGMHKFTRGNLFHLNGYSSSRSSPQDFQGVGPA